MPGTIDLGVHLGKIIKFLGVTPEELGLMLGVPTETVFHYLAGEAFPSESADQRIDQTVALCNRLGDNFNSPAAVQQWLRSRSRYLKGRRPIDVLVEGRFDQVGNALDALEAGIFV